MTKPSHSQDGHIKPVFVLGISGASWQILDLMLEQKRLPHFQRLIDRGCSGVMQSIRADGDKHFRPQTAWPTLASGVIPEHHGVTRFWHTSKDLRSETVWEIFQRNGQAIGLYGWPMTWPPSASHGFIIPCHHARDAQTWPPELTPIKGLDQNQKTLEREKGLLTHFIEGLRAVSVLFRFGLRASTFATLSGLFVNYLRAAGAEERALLLRIAKLELSVDFFLSLYDKYSPTFVTFTSFLVDLVSHRYWRYYQPEKFGETDPVTIARFRGALENAYELMDATLARCIATMPEDAVVAVVSEHGMSAEVHSTEVGPYRYVIQGSRLLKLVGASDEIISCPVARWLALRHRFGAKMPAGLFEQIQQIRVVETGLPLFQVHRNGDEEVIVKFNIDHKVARYQAGRLDALTLSYAGNHLAFLDLARPLGRQRSAMHDGQAVLIMAGPGIRHGERIVDFNLLDFAPTLLHASGLAIPSGMEGKVLDIFE